jgi:prepilin-type N-terminal cleavage/methylation domain-containing protein
MIKLLRRLQKKGFTLIELLVVIAIIATLAAILTPAVSNALLKGNVTQTISNGKQLYTLMFAEDMSNPLGLQATAGSVSWPTNGLPNSNDFFEKIATNESFNINFAFFAAKGVSPARDLTEFRGTGLRNAWCVTLGVNSGTSAGTPVFFTQNIDLTATKNLGQFQGLSGSAAPFGDKASVVVTYGGSVYSMDKSTATITNFFFSGAVTNMPAAYPRNGLY